MSDQLQSETDDSINRVISYGMIWLNPAFVSTDVRSRVFRRVPGLKNVRMGKFEAIWIGISLVVLSLSFYAICSVLALIPGVNQLIAPWTGIIAGVILSWPVGRRIARVSPYRRHSGEGLTEFLFVQSSKRHTFLGRLLGRSVATTKCVTYVSGKREVVECVEWLGTARAKFMPDWDPDNPREFMDIKIPPRHTPVDWVDFRRARRRLAGAKRA